MQARKKLELFAASAGLPLLGVLSDPMDFKALNYSLFVALYFFKLTQEERLAREESGGSPIMAKKREQERLKRIKAEEGEKGRGFIALSIEFFILYLASTAAIIILSTLTNSMSTSPATFNFNCLGTAALTAIAWLTVMRFFELSLFAAFLIAGLSGLNWTELNTSSGLSLQGCLEILTHLAESFLSCGATLGLALLFLHGHFAHHRNSLKLGNYQYLLAVVLVGGMNRLGLLLFGP